MPDLHDDAANEMQAAFADARKIQREKEAKEKKQKRDKKAAIVAQVGPGAASGAATPVGELVQ